ncbi:CHAD domain-containing protein [Marinobacter salinisoli]|uniref:CHAD domain-containing protein n=1 Tax=Marinobacter salinisoli TaxID=2769486 RepID=A0ABX7MY11_9GAMM|nr:CHAD domain-containing protein [Marinobacter salinisoli]QSP95088.1 CHAD domain-containing protein [Marinobacter salinisoli]
MRYRLSRDGNFNKQLKRLIQSVHEDIALSLLQATREPETGVHEARKRTKEIRALLRLIRPWMGEAEYTGWRKRYRALAQKLGDSRDADVRLKTWRALVEQCPELQVKPFKRVARFLDDDKKRARSEVGDERFFLSLAQEVEAQRTAVQNWTLVSAPEELAAEFQRIYKKARRAQKKARKSEDIEDFHRFRKRSKDLFYCSRALRPVYGKRLKQWVRELQEVTEIQGQANDQAVLLDYLKEQRSVIGLDVRHWNIAKACVLKKRKKLQIASHKRARRLFAESDIFWRNGKRM